MMLYFGMALLYLLCGIITVVICNIMSGDKILGDADDVDVDDILPVAGIFFLWPFVIAICSLYLIFVGSVHVEKFICSVLYGERKPWR